MSDEKTKAFAQMPKDLRTSFLEKLSRLIADVEFTIIAVVVDKLKQQQRGVMQDHPYHLALLHGLTRLQQRLHAVGQDGVRTTIVFESRGNNEDNALELEFRRVCDAVPMMFDIIIADKRVNCEGLQIADLTARPIGLSVIRPNQTNRALEIVASKLHREITDDAEYTGVSIIP